jgi:hypothetical protein
MPIYSCRCCNYSTTIKSNYNKHTKTKKHRVNEEIALENENELTPSTEKEPKRAAKEPKRAAKEPKRAAKKLGNQNNSFSCDYCSESFSTYPNKRRHEKHRCKENDSLNYTIIQKQENQINKLEKQIEKQKREMEKDKKEMRKQIELLLTKVGTTNNTTINTTNNIQLNNYGSEDLSHITDTLKTQLIKIPFLAIHKLIEKIHFNEEKPENTNIMITNKRDNKISIFENGKWVYKNKKRTLKNIIDDKYYILEDYYGVIPDGQLTTFNHNIYKNFRKKYENGDRDTANKMYEDAEIVILNNQEV